jgi:hypothetical protein
MSNTKINMSLDDIIKSKRGNSSRGGKSRGRGGSRGGNRGRNRSNSNNNNNYSRSNFNTRRRFQNNRTSTSTANKGGRLIVSNLQKSINNNELRVN